MSTKHAYEEAVDVLQELGLKEYEAKCFAGLARLPHGTAKELSEITDVPRTRVYDAVRVLEAQGLVEVQHKSPQQFRAVPIDEAMQTLRDRYESRVRRLADALQDADPVDIKADDESVQEVWSLTGPDAIEARAESLLDSSTDEIVLVIGEPELLTDELVETLNEVGDDVDIFVGTASRDLANDVEDRVSRAETFVSGLEWLHAPLDRESDLAIGRLLLVDRSHILVSTIIPSSGEEHAIYGGGFGNGLIVISRRLMAQGLIPVRPADD